MIRLQLGYPLAYTEIGEKIQIIATKMIPELEDLTYEEILTKNVTDSTQREKNEETISIYKLMNNLEKTDIKHLILKRKRDEYLWDTNIIQLFPDN